MDQSYSPFIDGWNIPDCISCNCHGVRVCLLLNSESIALYRILQQFYGLQVAQVFALSVSELVL